MHDTDSYFQYFTIDFQEPDTAYHGSNVLTQAVFVNDALEKIRSMYETYTNPFQRPARPTRKKRSSTSSDSNSDGESSATAEAETESSAEGKQTNTKANSKNSVNDVVPQIIIVAHSLGGIVARAAVTLSNHPTHPMAPSGCLVSDILMLSAPNIK
jgi:PGAP1-like protein